MKRRLASVDYETLPIRSFPEYPPKPVGVVLQLEGERKGHYWRWGHPGGNNCTKEEAVRRIKDVYRDCACIFHYAQFDLDVSETHLGLALPVEYHDTLLLSYLKDPRVPRLGLKELSALWLDLPPDEQSRLRDWIITNVPAARKKKKDWGAWIAAAPGDVVEPYALGDGVRTMRLFKAIYPQIQHLGMDPAYRRELRLIPTVLRMQRKGMPVAVDRLARDLKKWEREQEEREHLIRKRLRAPSLDLDKGDQLADALDRSGKMNGWLMTDGGKNGEAKRSTAMPALQETLKDRALLALLRQRSVMATYMQTFARPWLEAAAHDGRLHVIFNATRQPSDAGGKGTRTGRFSTSPNLQNVPKPRDLADIAAAYGEGFVLPNMRDYLIPEKNQVLLVRDYDQQELKLFAHFEDGALMREYNENPELDIHAKAQVGVNGLLGTSYPRKPIKNLGFGILYGQGIGRTAEVLGTDTQSARRVKEAYFEIIPGMKKLQKETMKRGENDEPIVTWGGRLYHVEPPRVINGRLVRFEYKLMNLLIQGSAADQTKEAMNRADEAEVDLRLSVHDELGAMARQREERRQMKLLREAMEGIPGFDVPMRSSGTRSLRSWGIMEKCS